MGLGESEMAKPSKKEGKTPEERAVNNLQYALDRACNFIHDGNTSYARRARTAAQRGVDRATVDKGVAAMKEAVADLEASIERAYKAPDKPAQPTRRAVLE